MANPDPKTMINPIHLSISLLLLAAMVAGDCNCNCDYDSEDHGADQKTVLPYKVGALFIILVASAVGVAVPLAGKRIRQLSPDRDVFFVVKAFAAGVILSTGFIHILPDAFHDLTSPCLKGPAWEDFPFAGFAAMMAAVGTMMIESAATGYYRRVHFGGKSPVVDDENAGEHAEHVHVHTHATHGHAHGDVAKAAKEDISRLELLRHRVTTQVLELGIVVHSVIIGITMGASTSLHEIKALMVALCFHQFFEGMGLGGCIAQARFKWKTIVTMGLFFSLTTPVGLAIGIIVTTSYHENDPKALIVQGLLNAAAAGILIYMALVDLLAADFMSPRVQNNPRLHLISNLSLLLGAGCMSVLAKWA